MTASPRCASEDRCQASSSRRRELQVLYLKLDVGVPIVLVENGFDGQVDSNPGLEAFPECAVIKRDAFHLRIALADVKLKMVAGFADAPRRCGDFQALD